MSTAPLVLAARRRRPRRERHDRAAARPWSVGPTDWGQILALFVSILCTPLLALVQIAGIATAPIAWCNGSAGLETLPVSLAPAAWLAHFCERVRTAPSRRRLVATLALFTGAMTALILLPLTMHRCTPTKVPGFGEARAVGGFPIAAIHGHGGGGWSGGLTPTGGLVLT